MTVKKRITVLIAITVAFTVTIALIGFLGAVSLSSKLEEIGRDGVLATRDLANTADAMWQLRYGVSQYLAVPERASRKKIIDESPKWFAAMDENLKRYATRNMSDEAGNALKRLTGAYEKYKADRPGWFELMESGKIKEAAEFRSRTILLSGAESVKALNTLIEAQAKRSDEIGVASRGAARRIKVLIVLVGAMLVCMSTALGIFLARNLLQQLGGDPAYVAGVARRVADGDLTMLIERQTKDTSSLLFAMDNMVARLKEIVGNAKTTADQVASAGEQLLSSSGEMSKGVAEQAGRVSQIASASAEMTQTAVDMARNVTSIAESAKESSKIADRGKSIVGKSIGEVRTIADTINESASLIASLGKRSTQIGEIVGVITEIAGQTQLLALNAAIEAARAGEQGRGFAVVADEVNKLSDKTAKATSQIASMIKSIQNEVQQTISSMQQVTQRVEVGVDLSAQAGEALDKIVASVGELQSMIQQIAAAIEEMSSVAGTIGGDIESIAGVSKNTSAGSVQVSSAATQLSRLASDLKGIVGQFRIA